MKKIRYLFHGNEVEMDWSEINKEIAKAEADNGECTIVDDGQPDPVSIPSQLDRIESQMTYLAMMTGCPEILEV